MDISWVDHFREGAESAIKAGNVRGIDFAGPTYQIEVYDPSDQESYWPFFQFNDQGELRDAFCSCPSDEEGCLHLAAAYLKIHEERGIPYHLRFARSLWNILCRRFAEHSGYDSRLVRKVEKNHYLFENQGAVSLRGEGLEALVENRSRETPETSLKFSNLSSEEVERWKEGRPTAELRYTLSFWYDLAKLMMVHEKEITLTFEEDEQSGLPLHLKMAFAGFVFEWDLQLEDLIALIPTLDHVEGSLKLFPAQAEKIETIDYDPQEQTFTIVHQGGGEQHEGKPIGEWVYVSGEGFYSSNGLSLLAADRIPKGKIASFLDACHEKIAPFLPIHPTPVAVNYAMSFDESWSWHLEAYLFEKGDLQKKGGALFGKWGYLPEKGFYRLQDPLFAATAIVLKPEEVSHFVNHNRIWLNGQEGFQTHLASIETHLTYSLTEDEGLQFHTRVHAEANDSRDFGDWVYYRQLGFFSKKHARLGTAVRPGVVVKPRYISKFLKAHREELEHIPNLFTTRLPVEERGLEIEVKSLASVVVKPVYRGESGVVFYGDFAYKEGEGFAELPPQMRLPTVFQSECLIGHEELTSFLLETLPKLEKYVKKIDSRLRIPHKVDLEVGYLVRTPGGGLKAKLYFVTEYGKIPVTELYEGLQRKRHFHFSEGGLLDLKEERFQWIRHLSRTIHPEEESVELTTLEFLRLDATFNCLAPPKEAPLAEISTNLLKELRSFISHERADLSGLKSELRLYQQTGLQWLWFLYKNGLSGLLCDDMGLGKTHQAMALMAATLNQKDQEKRRYLVVCPTSVIYHWQDKLETFLPGMKVHTFHGLKRTLKRLPAEGVVLTTYGIMRTEKENLQKIPFELAIFDEIQTAKNPSSRVHHALQHVNARMRVGLTGTPIENNLRELKALFDIVLPGYMPGEKRFRELFINPIERDLNEEKKALLSQMIRPFILRRRKSEVLEELPEKSEDKSYCELSPEQITLYQETLAQNTEEMISELRDREATVNYIHIFSLLSRLKQVCDHPALVAKDPKNYKKYHSGKWELFVELMEEARESEQKVVVFSQYLYMLDIIENFLKERGWGYAQIRGDTIDRRGELKRFQEDPSCLVFIGSLQAAGVGIDLTAASVVILYDRWWNAARENQAIDRVHRIGQKWGVQVYKLIAKGTIEEKIDRMILRKGRLLDEVVAADDQAVLKKFSRSELIDLLSWQGS